MLGSRCWVEKEGPGGAEDPGHWALTLPVGLSVAVNRLPDFLAAPNTPRGQPLPHHQCSIHLNCEDTLLVHRAFEDALDGLPSKRWGTWRRPSPCLEHRVCVGVGAGPHCTFTSLGRRGPESLEPGGLPESGTWG